MIKKTIILSASLLGIAALALSVNADNREASKTTKAEAKSEKKESKEAKATGAVALFPEKLYNAKGEEVSRDELKDKIVGIYFSAHWCPPCRAFTPNLVKFRDENKDDFEIVFVSSDKNADAQMNYMKESKMKWLTVKFGTKEVQDLKKKYSVRGIPKLVIVGPDGKTITENGRGDVSQKPTTTLAAWKKKTGA